MLSNALTEWIKVNIILDLYVSVHNAFWLFVSVTYKQKKIERLGLSNDYGYINKPCWPAFFLLVIRLRFTIFSATNTLSITNSMMNGCIGHHQSLFMLVFTSHNLSSVFHHFLPHKYRLTTYFYLSNTWTMKELCLHYSISTEIH